MSLPRSFPSNPAGYNFLSGVDPIEQSNTLDKMSDPSQTESPYLLPRLWHRLFSNKSGTITERHDNRRVARVEDKGASDQVQVSLYKPLESRETIAHSCDDLFKRLIDPADTIAYWAHSTPGDPSAVDHQNEQGQALDTFNAVYDAMLLRKCPPLKTLIDQQQVTDNSNKAIKPGHGGHFRFAFQRRRDQGKVVAAEDDK